MPAWKQTAAILALLVCVPQAGSQKPFPPSPIVEEPRAQARGIQVLSLNLRGIKDGRALLKSVREGGEVAELMLLQEVVRPAGDQPGVVDRLGEVLGMDVFFAPAYPRRNGDEEGLAILSRYPLRERTVMRLPRMNLRWKSRPRIAVAASVETPHGPIRVYNLHLDSRMGIKDRLKQLQPVTDAAAQVRGPVLIGGDFNTNPYGWLQHTLPLPGPNQPARMQKRMRELGYDAVFPRPRPTSRYFGMQLDWIFIKRLLAEGAEIRPVNFSDHHVLRARLRFSPGESQP